MPLRLFRSRNVAGANLVQALLVVGMFGMFFLGALYMQRILRYDALQVGLAYLPLTAVMAAMSFRFTGQLNLRLGALATLVPAMVFIVAGLLLLARTPVEATYAVDLLPASPSSRRLRVRVRRSSFAVGTGRIALQLTRAGVRVDGIEQSLHMVDRLREKPGGEKVEVTMGDMSRATTGRSYGLVYLVYNKIGNLLTQEDQVRCFENAARHLEPNGVFVLECLIPTASSRPGHQFVDVEEIGADHVELDVNHYDPVTQILDENHVTIGSGGIVSARSGCGWPTRPSST
jgi:Methyltransferase domain